MFFMVLVGVGGPAVVCGSRLGAAVLVLVFGGEDYNGKPERYS